MPKPDAPLLMPDIMESDSKDQIPLDGLKESQVMSDDDDFDPKSMLPSARGSSPRSKNNNLLDKFEDNLLDISEIQQLPDHNRSTDIVIGEAHSNPMIP